jgi:hypothetical protein
MIPSWGVVVLSLSGFVVWSYVVLRRLSLLRAFRNGTRAVRNRVVVLDFLVWTFTLTQLVTSFAYVNWIDAETARNVATAERLVILVVGLAIAIAALRPEDHQ